MASQRSGSLLAALAFAICILIPSSSSSKEAMELFERACHCFDDPNIYSQCAQEFRLNAEGLFHVQKNEVDEYCGGWCLEETKLALQCVEDVASHSFKFSNGASVLAVKQALDTGCSNGPDRGSFEIRERKECAGGADESYYHKSRDHEQEKPVGGPYYYGEGSQQQPYEQGSGYGGSQHQQPYEQGSGYGEGSQHQQPYTYEQGTGGYGEGEEYCYGYGAAGRLEERRGYLQMMILLLVASAPLILTL